jgi:membrane protease YdiL (CAAX protease family)
LAGNAAVKTIFMYYVVAVVTLLSGYMFPTGTQLVNAVPIAFSLFMLVPLYMWERSYQKKAQLSSETVKRDMGMTLFWIFTIFTLAMSIRIPSILLFNQPYEKTALIYLLVLAVLLVENNNPSAIGFKTQNLGKSLLYGVAFFATLAGVTLALTYALIFAFTGQMPVQSFDYYSALMTLPFMTLCVGISEEGFFRGYVQTNLEKFLTSQQANLTQAILFGGWHFVWYLWPYNLSDMSYHVIATFFIGLVFGYFYSKKRNLVPLILVHGLWNSVPPSIIENQTAIQYFAMFPTENQVLVLILPFAFAALATVIFTKYGKRGIWRKQNPK